MKRQDKYPETSTFHYYNANPKNRITGDCWARAICTALEIPYEQVVMEMAEMQCKTGYDASELIGRYLKSKGWKKQSQPRKDDNTKYTVEEFCWQLQKDPWIFTGKENDYKTRNLDATDSEEVASGVIKEKYGFTDEEWSHFMEHAKANDLFTKAQKKINGEEIDYLIAK